MLQAERALDGRYIETVSHPDPQIHRENNIASKDEVARIIGKGRGALDVFVQTRSSTTIEIYTPVGSGGLPKNTRQ
jgi:hypothetical protein